MLAKNVRSPSIAAVKRGFRSSLMTAGIVATLVVGSMSTASAQNFRTRPDAPHYPFHHRMPPGANGYYAAILGRAGNGGPQAIRVVLPSKGNVVIYGNLAAPISQPAPATFGVGVGYTYRIQISNMPEFPEAVLFPSVEIIDRLHPPKGQRGKFPIPIHLSREDIEIALSGRFVTKVVYLEQPQLASPLAAPVPEDTIPADRNALAEADRRGRPMVIVRIGGRRLDVKTLTNGSFGPGGPVTVMQK